jgi:hypothetical protein
MTTGVRGFDTEVARPEGFEPGFGSQA